MIWLVNRQNALIDIIRILQRVQTIFLAFTDDEGVPRNVWSFHRTLTIVSVLSLTRCACAWGAPQPFHAKSRRTHRTPTPCDWLTRRFKKIAYENSSTCTVHSTFLFTNFVWFTKIGFSFDFPQTFRKDSSCRIDQRDQVSKRACRESARLHAPKDVHMPWRSAKLQACMKSANLNPTHLTCEPERTIEVCMKSAYINPTHVTTRELERTIETTRHRVGDHNPADRSASRSEQWSIRASCQTTSSTMHVHANGCLLALVLLHGERSLCWNSARVGSLILRWE